MLSQYVPAFEVRVQSFPYNFSCGSPLDSFNLRLRVLIFCYKPPTSTGLNPSWRNRKFNNIVEPTDNIVWLFKFCSGPGINAISPDVKSYILETQCLLVLLVHIIILWLFKQELVIRLLFKFKETSTTTTNFRHKDFNYI